MSDQESDDSPRHVVGLGVENLTPVARTPWGGTRIRRLKGLSGAAVVGESWELSVEPSFVSRTDAGVPLTELLRQDPEHWLGREAPRGGTSLLVKLLDAREALSVQIHPPDDDPDLAAGEAGKPESWYVVEADEGAGIYLGLTEGADEPTWRATLRDGGDASGLLTFVPVETGDFFRIDAGTPHCVGPGVFLVEPQRVMPSRRGVTYRYWDWNRRYDGQPRPLHVERAIAVTRWDRPRGEALLAQVRLRSGPPSGTAATLDMLLGPDGLPSEELRVARLSGSGTLELPDWGLLGALTVLAGTVSIRGLTAGAGRTLAVAARSETRRVTLSGGHAIFSSALP